MFEGQSYVIFILYSKGIASLSLEFDNGLQCTKVYLHWTSYAKGSKFVLVDDPKSIRQLDIELVDNFMINMYLFWKVLVFMCRVGFSMICRKLGLLWTILGGLRRKLASYHYGKLNATTSFMVFVSCTPFKWHKLDV